MHRMQGFMQDFQLEGWGGDLGLEGEIPIPNPDREGTMKGQRETGT